MNKRLTKKLTRHFEDVFFRIQPLWQPHYPLTYGNQAKTFIESLSADYDKIDFIVGYKKRGYDGWDDMMVFVMYQVLTQWGLDLLAQERDILAIDDIPLEAFERQYKENLEYEGNERYLARYKGRRGSV